jgi:hypothetical protein
MGCQESTQAIHIARPDLRAPMLQLGQTLQSRGAERKQMLAPE